MSDLNRIETKIDKITDKIETLSNLAAKHEVLHKKNTEDLAEHIKRTDKLEDRMEQHSTDHNKKLEEALLPIKAAKFLVALAVGISAIVAVIKLL